MTDVGILGVIGIIVVGMIIIFSLVNPDWVSRRPKASGESAYHKRASRFWRSDGPTTSVLKANRDYWNRKLDRYKRDRKR